MQSRHLLFSLRGGAGGGGGGAVGGGAGAEGGGDTSLVTAQRLIGPSVAIWRPPGDPALCPLTEAAAHLDSPTGHRVRLWPRPPSSAINTHLPPRERGGGEEGV